MVEDTIGGQRIPKELYDLMLNEKSFHKTIGINLTNKQAFRVIAKKAKKVSEMFYDKSLVEARKFNKRNKFF